MIKKSIALIMLVLISGAAVYSQSLENNEYYQKSVEYANRSQQAIDSGDYETGRQYALQSQEYAAQSRRYIDEMLLAYRARSSYIAAKASMDNATRLNLKNRDPDLYAEASKTFESATALFNAEDYEKSIPESRKVIDLLRDIYPSASSGTGLAAFYEVKLNPNRRDCLWRIAEYDFIYGDPYQWSKLYEANKDKFPEPGNPDLIEPGMVLTVPSIKGETRSGTR